MILKMGVLGAPAIRLFARIEPFEAIVFHLFVKRISIDSQSSSRFGLYKIAA